MSYLQGDIKPTIDRHQTYSMIEEEARKALYRQTQTERELEKARKKISELQSKTESTKVQQPYPTFEIRDSKFKIRNSIFEIRKFITEFLKTKKAEKIM